MNESLVGPQFVATCLSGGGVMGELMRQLDWNATALGAVECWPQSLRTAVNILLESKFPMYIAWGEEYIQFYNDGYRPILGSTKHPGALGSSTRETFAESWSIIGPMFADVRRGIASGSEDWMLPLDRNGYLEECYFTFSYSPIRDETGGVGGVLVTVTETTARVLGERRLETLRALAGLASQAKEEHATWAGAVEICSGNPADLAFCLLYRSTGPQTFELEGSTGLLGTGSIGVAPRLLEYDGQGWPVNLIRTQRCPILVDNVAQRFGEIIGPKWPEAIHSALLLLIDRPGLEQPYGLLIVGVSPRRALDEQYRSFLTLISDHVATGIGNVRAHEEERRRVESLAELDRAKTQFFSNVSHEFRTPLTLMLGPLSDLLASKEHVSSEVMESLRVVHRNGLRLLRLVNSLLDFARIEAGRIQAKYAATDLCKLTEDLASIFHSAMERAGLELRVNCRPMPQPVWVDQEMWEKVVLNLVSNALKYTFNGSVAVELEAVDGYAQVRVSDTGTGIPEAELPHIFERFRRIEGARGRTFEGSGIGLALVQELVRLHGGTIQVESTVDKGSTFTVALPFGNAHLPNNALKLAGPMSSTAVGVEAFAEQVLQWVPEEANPSGQQGVLEPEPASFKAPSHKASAGARVLVADDNADMRNYMRRLLSQAGYEVETAGIGDEAISRALASHPDLVLCDIMMPGIDGFGVLKALRSDPSTQAIPLILVSARAGEEARAEGIDAGADDYLTKPFSAREVLARVSGQIRLASVRRQAQEQAKVILESITDGFFALDRDWRFIYVNSEGERLIGFRRDQMIGKSIWEAYPEAIDTLFYGEYMRAMNERVPVEFESYYTPLQTWFRVKAYPAENGGLSVFYEDVTERKRAEQSLKQSEERYRSLFDQVTDGIFVTDQEGRYIDANPAAWSMLGYTRDELLGLFIPDVLVPAERAKLPAHYERLQGGEIVRDDWRFLRKDGSELTGELVERRLRDGRFQAIVRDVTERKCFEKALLESEEQFRTLANGIANLAWMADPSGSIFWYNQRWYEYTGTTLEQMKGWGWQSVHAPENLPQVLERWKRSIDSGEPLDMIFPLRGGDGRFRSFLTRVQPVKDSQGKVVRWFGTNTDISVQLQTEQELRRANQDLEQFAYSASHDLQEPLRMVAVYSQLLERRYGGALDQEGKEIVRQVVGGAHRMGNLLSDLLAYAQAGSLLEDASEPVESQSVLNDVMEDLAHSIVQNGAHITSDSLPVLFVKPSHLRQLFQNLIGNALKYRKESEAPMVHISATRNAAMWQLSIADNGIGIPPEYQHQVFGLFKRLHSDTNKYSGTGIGLAICHKIVDRYGGRIWIESESGSGSTFHFTLPGPNEHNIVC